MFSIRQQAQNPNILDIYIYDDILGDSYNWWTGEKKESETSANYVKQVLENNQMRLMFILILMVERLRKD